jgi:hypothetical protein
MIKQEERRRAMDKKKFTYAALAYIVLTFAIAASWHLVIFKDMYDQLGIFTRKEPIIPLGIASMIMQAIVLSYLYPRYYRGGSILKEGLIFGALTGVLMASIAVFAEAGKQQVTSLPFWLVFESAYYLLQFSISGVVIAKIYGKDPGSV